MTDLITIIFTFLRQSDGVVKSEGFLVPRFVASLNEFSHIVLCSITWHVYDIF